MDGARKAPNNFNTEAAAAQGVLLRPVIQDPTVGTKDLVGLMEHHQSESGGVVQGHGQTNLRSIPTTKNRDRSKKPLQHGEDKQESQQELFHQSVPQIPNHPDSVGTKTLREVLLREKHAPGSLKPTSFCPAFQLVKGVATKVSTKMSTASSANYFHALEETATADAVTLLALCGSI